MIALGHALSVNAKCIAVYSEAMIRSNIIYHLSNLLELADDYLSLKLELPPFTAISAGTAIGIVRRVKHCDMLNNITGKERPGRNNILAFVDEVQGDEEFPE